MSQQQPNATNQGTVPTGYQTGNAPMNVRPLTFHISTHNRQWMFRTGDQVCVVMSQHYIQEPNFPWQPVYGKIVQTSPNQTQALVRSWEYGSAGWHERDITARYDEIINLTRTPVPQVATTMARVAALRTQLLDTRKCEEINSPPTWILAERTNPNQSNADVNEIRNTLNETIRRKKDLVDAMRGTNKVISRMMRTAVLETSIRVGANAMGVGPSTHKISETILHVMQLSDGIRLRDPNILPDFVREVADQIASKVYAMKKPEEFVDTLTILAAAVVMPEKEVIRKLSDKRPNNRQGRKYKYLNFVDEIYSTRGMIPGDKFDATTFNINGWTFDPDEAEDANEDQLREMLKKAKETCLYRTPR